MYQLQITTQAEQDLQDAVNYIRDVLHNPSAAINLVDEVDRSLGSLSDFPERNPLVRDTFLATNGIRLQVIGNYIALYAVREDSKKVVILRILHSRRDWISVLISEVD